LGWPDATPEKEPQFWPNNGSLVWIVTLVFSSSYQSSRKRIDYIWKKRAIFEGKLLLNIEDREKRVSNSVK